MVATPEMTTVDRWDRLHSVRRNFFDYPSEEVFRFLTSTEMDQRTGKAIDVGCGSGRHFTMLKTFGYEPFGVDTSPEALDQAAKYGEVVSADMAELPCEDGTFDVALCMAVAFYGDRDNLFATFAEIRRVLRPGGHALFSLRSPRDWRIKTGEEVAPNTILFDIPDHLEDGMTVYHATAEDIRELANGWQGVSVELDEHTRDNMTRFESHYIMGCFGMLDG